jgi:hypothetical protein
MVLSVKKPVYTKVTTATGATEPVHTFALESDWILKGSGQSPAEVLVAAIAKEGPAIQAFLTEFLRLTATSFAKPYSVSSVLKSLKHTVESTATGSLQFQPSEVLITVRGFQIRWTCREEEGGLISLPDMEDSDDSEDADSIPLSNTNEVIQLQSPNIRHVYDRQKVKEANLRAKLAQYKANRTHLEYVEKYGQDLSDSSDTESEESDDSQ